MDNNNNNNIKIELFNKIIKQIKLKTKQGGCFWADSEKMIKILEKEILNK